MEKIFTYAKFAIHPGKAEEFKRRTKQCLDIVVQRIGSLMRQLMTISDRYLEIYGKDPSPTLAGRGTAKPREFFAPLFLGKL